MTGTGLVLRLAGPLQSWGEHSAFIDRDTVSFPTRSGLVGMFAGAMGLRRGESLTRFGEIRLTVRVDAPGVLLTDFHTVGGGLPPARTVPTADGKHRSGDTGTMVTRRRYLSDAVFTVAVTGSPDLLDDVGEALLAPRWQPYLGRRSCPPDQPFLLRRRAADPEGDLRGRVPLPRRPRFAARAADGTVDVDVYTETERANAAVTELADVPVDFAPLGRRYGHRNVYREVVSVKTDLFQRPGREYREALFRYMREGQ
jgi:CRISPR system Cascade subunit CasD